MAPVLMELGHQIQASVEFAFHQTRVTDLLRHSTAFVVLLSRLHPPSTGILQTGLIHLHPHHLGFEPVLFPFICHESPRHNLSVSR